MMIKMNIYACFLHWYKYFKHFHWILLELFHVIITVSILILTEEEMGTEQLSILPRVRELLSSTADIWTQFFSFSPKTKFLYYAKLICSVNTTLDLQTTLGEPLSGKGSVTQILDDCICSLQIFSSIQTSTCI